MKRLLTIIGLCATLTASQAQTIPTEPPPFDTNAVLKAAGASAVATFALNLLPGWDKTANSFTNLHEFELEVSPAWKAVSASGSTPFLSIGGQYMFTRYFGAGGDIITLGNGSGSSDIDSAHVFAIARKDIGNVAGYAMLGGGRDVALNRFSVDFGVGLEYRYSTGIGLIVDTRYLKYITKLSGQPDHDFLTRVGATIHF